MRSPRSSRPLPVWARGWRKGLDSSNSEGKESLLWLQVGAVSCVLAHSVSGRDGFPGRTGISSYPAPSDFT